MQLYSRMIIRSKGIKKILCEQWILSDTDWSDRTNQNIDRYFRKRSFKDFPRYYIEPETLYEFKIKVLSDEEYQAKKRYLHRKYDRKGEWIYYNHCPDELPDDEEEEEEE